MNKIKLDMAGASDIGCTRSEYYALVLETIARAANQWSMSLKLLKVLAETTTFRLSCVTFSKHSQTIAKTQRSPSSGIRLNPIGD